MEKSLKNYLSVFVLALIWGSSFILMKKGLEVYDYMQVANARIFIAFISLVPFLPRAVKEVKKKHYFPIFITSLFGNGLPAILFTKAQTNLDSALVGILNSTVPLFTLIIAAYFFRFKPLRANIFGVLIGLAGVFFLTFNSVSTEVVVNKYFLFVILATIFYAISINVIKNYLQDLNPISIATLAFSIIGPMALIYLIKTDFIYQLNENDHGYKAIGYIALLAILGTSMASIIFNKLLARSSAIFTSSITYFIPIVAIFWGILDGEIVTVYHLVGFVIILAGVYLVNKD